MNMYLDFAHHSHFCLEKPYMRNRIKKDNFNKRKIYFKKEKYIKRLKYIINTLKRR